MGQWQSVHSSIASGQNCFLLSSYYNILNSLFSFCIQKPSYILRGESKRILSAMDLVKKQQEPLCIPHFICQVNSNQGILKNLCKLFEYPHALLLLN